MNRTTFPQSLESRTSVDDCLQAYQYWQELIQQQEEEISQLRVLLLDVMDRYNYRSLRHSAVDYYRDLNQLQTRLNWLNRDCICQGTTCSSSSGKQTCPDVRFGLSATIERQAAYLLNEFNRIKAECLQFLSSMMSLNLL